MDVRDLAAAATSITSTAEYSTPLPPSHDPDFSLLGSPEIADAHLEEVEEEEEEASHPSGDHQHLQTVSALTDDLRDKITKQVEYYFSDENLRTDKYLMKYVTQNVEGYVPIAVIASFRKMKKLTQDMPLIVAAVEESSFLVVSASRKMVRRLYSLPFTEVADPQLCTVLVENLPDDYSTENIERIFGQAGNIKNICIRDPHAAREPRKRTIAEKLLSGKLHALVEYETVDAAEKAVAMLNDQQDWRYGMRVKLLKRAVKHGKKKKGWQEANFESNNVHVSDPACVEENQNLREQLDDTHDEEDGSRHLLKVKNGYKAQNRRQGRGQRSIGQGHVTVSSSHGSEPSKPPPGPRMPDGTRGFSIGRGWIPASNQD